MGLILFFLFLSIPLIEIAVFIQVGGVIGLWPTIAVVIVTAALGAGLWRVQGLATWARAQVALNRGELPVAEVTDGAFLLVAGALLLTPGFVTDGLGFLLFVPAFRHWLARIVFRYLSTRIHVREAHMSGGPRPDYRGPTIEGDATEKDD